MEHWCPKKDIQSGRISVTIMDVSDLIVLVFFFCSALSSLEANVIPENSGYISKFLAILKIEGVWEKKNMSGNP